MGESGCEDVMRPEVRLYVLTADGSLAPLFDTDISYYGVCPNVGDVICRTNFRDGSATMHSVLRRYFVDYPGHQGWTVVLKPLEDVKEAQEVYEEYESSTKFWRDVDEQEQRESLESLTSRLKTQLIS